MKEDDNLNQLGNLVAMPLCPDDAVIETVKNPHVDTEYTVRFSCPEFTSLCPITGQPDFAKFTIDYLPNKKLIESKSLKLFMSSFRNHGAYHEDCTILIAKRLIGAANPKWLRISGIWYPRGGIPIDVYFQTGPSPKRVFVPTPHISSYQGRE